MAVHPRAIEALSQAPLFADLTRDEVEQVASLFKARQFRDGETIIKEGLGGAAFYVIDHGEAIVTIGGVERGRMAKGDYFGEIALFDEGARMATITASGSLTCYGLTYWDFRPLVEKNGVIGWKLLQRMAAMLREERSQRL